MLINDGRLLPLGHGQIADVSTAVGLTLPDGYNGRRGAITMVQALSQSVRWRDDGVDPTAGVGMLLAAGDTLVYNGDPTAIKFIETAASAELNVAFYQPTGNT